MKAFLFLYPISRYTEEETFGHPSKLKVLERLNAIIDIRYRQKGYRIFWLLFGVVRKPSTPNLSLLDARLRISKTDKVLSAGVSFERHCRRLVYPSLKSIIAQIQPVDELVIGGFHQTDCVDKLARAAHRQSISVRVDEDTTNQLFTTTMLDGLPPVESTQEEYASRLTASLARIATRSDCDLLRLDNSLRRHRAMRKKRPWLAQI